MRGSFLGSSPVLSALWRRVGFPQSPELTLSVMELVCTHLGLPGPPSMSWGLWGSGACLRFLGPPLCCGARGLVSAPWAPLCVSGLVFTFPLSPGPPSASWNLYCPCSVSPACTHCCRAWVFFFWLRRPTLCAVRFVCTAEVCMSPLSQHPGPPFAPQVLCALAEFA